MANERQVEKNLKKYGKKTRGKSKCNTRPVAKKVSVPITITINPCTEVNVVQARPYPVPGQAFEVM